MMKENSVAEINYGIREMKGMSYKVNTTGRMSQEFREADRCLCQTLKAELNRFRIFVIFIQEKMPGGWLVV